MPVHDNSLEHLLPRLRYLVNYFKIDYVSFFSLMIDGLIQGVNAITWCFCFKNLARMQSPGDEMELLMAVNRKYRYLFAQQEHMKLFKEYDSIEVIYSYFF